MLLYTAEQPTAHKTCPADTGGSLRCSLSKIIKASSEAAIQGSAEVSFHRSACPSVDSGTPLADLLFECLTMPTKLPSKQHSDERM